MPHPSRIDLILLLLLAGSARAQLRPEQIAVEIYRAPASANVRADVRVRVDGPGVCSVEATLTNASDQSISLGKMVLHFPWCQPEGTDLLLCAGGWDMGRTQARVHRLGETVESESYLIARHNGRYSLAGFVTWRKFTSRLAYRSGEIIVTADGEGRLLRAGETLPLEKIRLAEETDWQDELFAYAEAIAHENKIKLNKPRPHIGWSTWDYYGRGWTFQNVTDNLTALLKICPQADLLQIDGGWWPQRGDYLTWRDSLNPGGMKELATIIRAKGLTAGIHLDGMRVDAKAQITKEHPEFLLKDQNGDLLFDPGVASEPVANGFFDYSNPATRDYMRKVLGQIRRDWGFDYIKIDFLRNGINEFIAPRVNQNGQKHEIVPFDRTLTSVERFHLAMATFREGMGADAYFLGCSSVFGPVFGHVDGLRTGADINPEFKQFMKCAMATSGNFYLHGRVVYNDGDYLVVRAKEDQDETLTNVPIKNGKNLTLNEAEMWTHFVALCGGPRLNSDDLLILREERRALFRFVAAFPTAERYVPLDFWSHGRNPEDVSAVILTQARGDVYVGTFNWADQDKEIVLTGLSATDIASLSKVAGAAVAKPGKGSLRVSLPARHSTIFKFAGGDFDRLRKAITVD